jgi:hypothetical protein
MWPFPRRLATGSSSVSDALAEDPDIVRLHDRIALDGIRELDGFRSHGGQVYAAKVEEARSGQRNGIIYPDGDPGVLLSMLIGTARSMAGERALRGIDGTIYGRATLKERRAAAVKAAEKLISPYSQTPVNTPARRD